MVANHPTGLVLTPFMISTTVGLSEPQMQGHGALPAFPRTSTMGPITGFVYETPGTYTATLTVRAPNGLEATETVEITVQDPDVVFAGTDTICISNTGDFSGAPAGALLITETDLDAALTGRFETGKRILLNRGETWSISGELPRIGQFGPGILGTYGEGARPIIENSASSNTLTTWWASGATGANDWRIMDLHFVSTIVSTPSTRPATAIQLAGNPREILVLRMKVEYHAIGTHFGSGGTRQDENGNTVRGRPDSCHVVECEFSGLRNSNSAGDRGGYGILGTVTNSFLMGNRVWDHTNGEHCVRVTQGVDSVLAHNDLRDPWSIKHALTIRAPHFPDEQRVTEYLVVRDNQIFGGDATWTVTVHATNAFTDERISNVLLENNFISADTGGSIVVTLTGENVAFRNNIIGNWNSSGSAIVVEERGLGPQPRDIRIYNNTIHAEGNRPDILSTRAGVVDVDFYNNLVISDRSYTMIDQNSGSTVISESNNLGIPTSEMVNSNPVVFEDYAPVLESAAVDGGITLIQYFDFLGNPRTLGLATDIGAIEVTNFDAYATWAADIAWAGQDSSATADPNGDGIINLLAFGMNLSPISPVDPADLPATSVTVEGETKTISYTLRRNVNASDLVFSLETTADLQASVWQTVTELSSGVSMEVVDMDIDGDGSTQLVRYLVELPDQGQDSFFLRTRWEKN